MDGLAETSIDNNPPLKRMLGFIDHDPQNLRLIADTAELAFQSGEIDIARSLFGRYGAIAALPPALKNLSAQAMMAEGEWAAAQELLSALIEEVGQNPVLKFNLAWCRAMLEDHAGTLELLDDETLTASPRAPALKIHMMHHLGLFEEALAEGDALIERFPDNHELAGALAVLAIDGEEPLAALKFAERAAAHSNEAATSLGTLKLNAFETEEAASLFERALELSPNDPRAHIGKGLVLLSSGDESAIDSLDRGAELFKDHIGSWIAAGWACFTKGDYSGARIRFDRALALDDNFAESHGALAVLDILADNRDEGRRRADVALRLDRQCYSAILAKSLLLESDGRADAAEALRKRAMATPIDGSGLTIAQAVIGFGARKAPKKR